MKILDELLDNFLSIGVPGCALSISYKGEVVYTGYRGVARIEDGKTVDENTICQIYSNSKNITAVAVMKLFEQGHILLNDSIEMYLPFFKNLKVRTIDGSNEIHIKPLMRPLRIKELLTMTAGIPYIGQGTMAMRSYAEIENPFKITTMELAEKIATIPLDFEPGKHFHYGMCFEILGALIEAVSGKRLGEYLAEEIFEPLEMSSTTFRLTQSMKKDLASIYELKDGKLMKSTAVPKLTDENGFKGEAGGEGLLSTIGDMINFATMLAMGGKYRGRQILSRNTIDLMRENHLEGNAMEDFNAIVEQSWPWFEGYGWGLGCRTLINKAKAGSNGSLGEFGWCGAAGTYLLADPEKQLGIAYAHQLMPVVGNLQDYCHPRIRNVVYSMVDEWENKL